MDAQENRASIVRRADAPMRDRSGAFSRVSHTAPANCSQSSRMKMLAPSSRPSPAHPTGVVTTLLPQAIASRTLMFVPAETSKGTTTTFARA